MIILSSSDTRIVTLTIEGNTDFTQKNNRVGWAEITVLYRKASSGEPWEQKQVRLSPEELQQLATAHVR